MNYVDYKITISGLKAKKGTIPISILKQVLDAILDSSEKILRLCVEGSSRKRGKVPKWLSEAVDFNLTGLEEGSTVLAFEAPYICDINPSYFAQRKLWIDRITEDDTAISLLKKTIHDISEDNLESVYLDGGVLKSMQSFKHVFRGNVKELEITSTRQTRDNMIILDSSVNKIDKLKFDTPEPRMTVLSGFFNVIEHSPRRFQLRMDDDKTVIGELESSGLGREDMRKFWGQKVTVKGIAHFRPSGKVHFIETKMIRNSQSGDEILEQIPSVQTQFSFPEKVLDDFNAGSALKKIWGKWPGDESIEELVETLKNPI